MLDGYHRRKLSSFLVADPAHEDVSLSPDCSDISPLSFGGFARRPRKRDADLIVCVGDVTRRPNANNDCRVQQ